MTQILTVETLTDADRALFSDMYKDAYGTRPRHVPTDEEIVSLFERMPQIMEEEEANEARALAAYNAKHGTQYASWWDYYDRLDANYEAEFAQIQAEAKAQRLAAQQRLSARSEFYRPGSSVPVIEAWDHGDLG